MKEKGYNVAPMDSEDFYKFLEKLERDEEERMKKHDKQEAGVVEEDEEPTISPETLNDYQGNLDSFLRKCNQEEIDNMNAYYRQKYGKQEAKKPQQPSHDDELTL